MTRKALAIMIAAVLAMASLPAAAFASEGAYSAASADSQAMQLDVQASQSARSKTVKKAKAAFKKYLAKHGSYKHFRVVNIGDNGIPVLLASKQVIFTALGPNFFIHTDVLIYDKTKRSKLKKLGTVSTGGTAYQLHYAKKALYGYRVAGLHTFAIAKVKNGRISMTGMYDDQYGDDLKWRHFSNYNPKTKGEVYESKALGKRGTKAQYMKLVRKYGKHPLKMYANTASNRAKIK